MHANNYARINANKYTRMDVSYKRELTRMDVNEYNVNKREYDARMDANGDNANGREYIRDDSRRDSRKFALIKFLL
jgi:hypothetical protein